MIKPKPLLEAEHVLAACGQNWAVSKTSTTSDPKDLDNG
jgi:hypothetical protein